MALLRCKLEIQNFKLGLIVVQKGIFELGLIATEGFIIKTYFDFLPASLTEPERTI